MKYVVIFGSFPEGVSDVVGPFDSRQAVMDHWIGRMANESDIYEVHDVSRVYNTHWQDRSRVLIEYEFPGKIKEQVAGPYPPDHIDDFYQCVWGWTFPVTDPDQFARGLCDGSDAEDASL